MDVCDNHRRARFRDRLCQLGLLVRFDRHYPAWEANLFREAYSAAFAISDHRQLCALLRSQAAICKGESSKISTAP
jgi:hypothetical protein